MNWFIFHGNRLNADRLSPPARWRKTRSRSLWANSYTSCRSGSNDFMHDQTNSGATFGTRLGELPRGDQTY
jgi:hypothetical protein